MPIVAPQFSLERSLSVAETSLSAVVRSLGSQRRVDLRGVAGGSLAYLLHRAHRELDRPMLVLCADAAEAGRVAADLRFFEHQDPDRPGATVLTFPSAENTPHGFGPDGARVDGSPRCVSSLTGGPSRSCRRGL